MKKRARNDIKLNKLIWIGALFLFVLMMVRAGQLSLSSTIDGIDLKKFASARTTQKDVIPAKRGTIYDVNGNILAQNVYSYTLIAYLDPSRTTDPAKPKHVVDVDKTAEALAPILEMDVSAIKELLSKQGVYQTEFGAKGKGLTEITKDKIVSLNLPGIDFIETQKRYYPNGDFLSYTLGYAKSNSDGTIVGEMGLEQYFNEELSGTDGSITYQKDLKGYQIAGTKEIKVDAIAGKDIYLTIDNNIQFFVEQAIKTAASKYTFDNLSIVVADAKTGKILADSTYPSFDPNVRNITNYLDPNVASAIEPGSTMKIYTYMAAMEAGVYKGDDLFQSGTYVTTDGTEIGDHDREGWGNITFDRGFALSSNVGALHLVKDYIDAKTLKDYFLKLGFGQVTGITLPRESAGKIDFRYETEVFNASFGQGIMTTAMQNIKALTSISNDGILLEPYIIDKIVDPTTGEVVYEGKKNELGRVASEQTTNKMKELMRSVVQEGTGTSYKMDGYDIIAKTGTAQIASTDGTGYLKGESDVIRGFAGMYPGDDPKVIIYATLKRPVPNSVAPLSNAIKEIIQNIAKYMDMEPVEQPTEEITSYEVPSYYNQNVTDIVDQLTNMQIASVVIGDGDRIIDQFPSQGTTITSKEKVYLITSGPNKVMPNLMGYSLKEADTLLSYYGISYTFTGSGYVTAQSIPEGTPITDGLVLTVTLAPKYVIEKEETSSP